MRELIFLEPGRLEWQERPDLRPASDLEAIVRPVAATPCDLDRAIVLGKAPLPGPFALGHECVAEVIAVGAGVQRALPGTLCVVPWHISCGACDRCRAGLTASCRAVPPKAMYGTPIGGAWGGLFSDEVRVPFADAMLVPLPAGVSPERAAPASDNLTDAWLCVSRGLEARPGARVLVVGGAGAVGLYAVDMARAAGAAEVVYVDRSEERGAIATALGGRFVTREAADRGALEGEEFPVVVDASANPAELTRALRATAPGGLCSSVGIYFLDAPLPLLDMYASDVTFRTGRPSVGPAIERVLALLAEGRARPERVSSVTAPWDEAPRVLLERNLKPVLRRACLGGSRPPADAMS